MDAAAEQIKEVYAQFGLAVYFGQCLEHAIVNALVVARLPKREEISQSEIDELVGQKFKLTLGRLIADLRKNQGISTQMNDLLYTALETRNWLCHGYFRDRAVQFTSVDGRNTMLSELRNAQTILQNADTALSETVAKFAAAFGINEEVVRREAKKLVGGTNGSSFM